MNTKQLENEIKELTLGLSSKSIVTLSKKDINISALCIKPASLTGETNEEFVLRALLQLLKDGWTAIPF